MVCSLAELPFRILIGIPQEPIQLEAKFGKLILDHYSLNHYSTILMKILSMSRSRSWRKRPIKACEKLLIFTFTSPICTLVLSMGSIALTLSAYKPE
ncbi:hypothetical protein BpHYR1_027527 [Brachionus plicatilis]|uniref:Uncharacterized protein n=1 Tax=Brachionus plicatilis TaxID=10195 RepID=A0A3M7SP42_BRAPC|nr:hypothetical protein BpHYR1_027527 [Brachionus plicatilis]